MEDRSRLFITLSVLLIGAILFFKWQSADVQPGVAPKNVPASAYDEIAQDKVRVSTDVLNVEIDLRGGDVVFAELKNYAADKNSENGFALLEQTNKRYYVAQSGMVSDTGPDFVDQTRKIWRSPKNNWTMSQNEQTMDVVLSWSNDAGIQMKKTYHFTKGSYDIDVRYDVVNNSGKTWDGTFYTQIRRILKGEKTSGFSQMQMYSGGAIFTPEKPFKKVSFDDMETSPLKKTIHGGWAALTERYFLTAWISDPNIEHEYHARGAAGAYAIGSVSPKLSIPANHTKSVGAKLYVGPQVGKTLETLSPGLELAVDYGFLWPISKAIFWIMEKFHLALSNWGFAILGVTLVLRGLFYKLSSKAFYSSAKMRKITPKLERIRQQYGNDKQRVGMETMRVMQEEKVNPLSGCLPLLVQMPVFLGLYYVLLESVELRHAPFVWWITDLAAKDPYYILPVVVGISMLVQQWFNPAPSDPVQAKVMMAMPFIFTFIFMSFPAGVMLYWAANNVLTILQQLFVNNQMRKQGLL